LIKEFFNFSLCLQPDDFYILSFDFKKSKFIGLNITITKPAQVAKIYELESSSTSKARVSLDT